MKMYLVTFLCILLCLTCIQFPDVDFDFGFGFEKKEEDPFVEKVLNDYLTKLNPEFSRETPVYSYEDLLIIKTSIKAELTAHGLEKSEDVSEMFEYIILGTFGTTKVLNFDKSLKVEAVAEVLRASIELLSDYSVDEASDIEDLNTIISSAVSYISIVGFEALETHLGVASVIKSFLTHTELLSTINSENMINNLPRIVKEVTFSLVNTDIVMEDLLQSLISVTDSFIEGINSFSNISLTTIEKLNLSLEVISRIISATGQIKLEKGFEILNLTEMASGVINSSIPKVKLIEGLSNTDLSEVEAKIISSGYSSLKNIDNNLVFDEVLDNFNALENISISRAEIQAAMEM